MLQYSSSRIDQVDVAKQVAQSLFSQYAREKQNNLTIADAKQMIQDTHQGLSTNISLNQHDLQQYLNILDSNKDGIVNYQDIEETCIRILCRQTQPSSTKSQQQYQQYNTSLQQLKSPESIRASQKIQDSPKNQIYQSKRYQSPKYTSSKAIYSQQNIQQNQPQTSQSQYQIPQQQQYQQSYKQESTYIPPPKTSQVTYQSSQQQPYNLQYQSNNNYIQTYQSPKTQNYTSH